MSEEKKNFEKGEALSPEGKKLLEAFTNVSLANGVEEALEGVAYLLLLACDQAKVTEFEFDTPTYFITASRKGVNH